MRKYIQIIFLISLGLCSCSSTNENSIPPTLPKADANPSNNSEINATEYKNKSIDINHPSFNEFPDKWPYLYSDLITVLKKNEFKTILMSKFPEFDLNIRTSGFRWIERAVLNRRQEYVTKVIKNTTYNFAKIFVNQKIKPLYKENMVKNIENSKNLMKGNVADAMLQLTGKITVTALYPLAETGFQYVLQLKYQMNAYLIDIATGVRCWYGDAMWRRNTIVNEAQAD